MDNNTSSSRPDEYLEVIDSRTKAEYILPIRNNAVKGTDIGKIKSPDKLGKKSATGLKVLDRGFMNTACVESSITSVDGDLGQIRYRGYDLEYLYNNHDYEEVMHLLIWGHLPSAEEKEALRKKLFAELEVPQSVINIIQSFPRQSPTQSMLIAGLAAYVACDENMKKHHAQPGGSSLGSIENTDAAILHTLAVMATTTALVYCHKYNRQFSLPDPDTSYVGSLVRMMGKADGDKKIENYLSRLWMLYADHEMTNSTAAFLHAASTLTDPLSSTISATVSSYGPLHDGAIESAYWSFQQIGFPENVPSFMNDVKRKRQRLFGFGQRIYKTPDPRVKFVRQMIDDITKSAGKPVPLLDVALEIDNLVSTDEYFVSRKWSANADLCGALMYTALGFESDMIIAMTMVSRASGLLAHWRESMQQSPIIWRPKQLYREPARPRVPSHL
ncbi:citrate synthase [Xylariaceae sp. FL0255]|nr:citrate synthase [Xylariaceae sp. FL0255]